MPPEHRFVWTLSGWPMKQVLWSGTNASAAGSGSPQAIRDGRLVWHALPASLHTESLDLEDLVRGMVFSSQSVAAVRHAAAARRENDRRARSHLGAGHDPEAGRG